jgi:ubiquinone/menaquinone biosynthesis C-methylase UbiE
VRGEAAGDVAVVSTAEDLKARVQHHWEEEACGARYGGPFSPDEAAFFEASARRRYGLEPYIPSFAGFGDAAGKRVLEVGVGMGADFANWCSHAAHATGVDLTDKALALTRRRLALAGVSESRYNLARQDAERLAFRDEAFDLVYAWGVLHHTPDPPLALRECFRVLKPGGALKAMIYHSRAWTNLMLWMWYAGFRGRFAKPLREVVFEHLESPGTRVYSIPEARRLIEAAGFRDVRLASRLGPSDLLAVVPSIRHRHPLKRLVWRLYPRALVRAAGDRFGLYLLVTACKPA